MLRRWLTLILPARFAWLLQIKLYRLFSGFSLAFVTALAGLGLLALSGWFITATALAGLATAAGIIVLLDVFLPGAGIRFFALSRTVSRYFERLYNHDIILRLLAHYRQFLFSALWNLPAAQLRQTTDSEWLSRFTADIDRLDSLWLRLLLPLLLSVAGVLFTAFALSLYWPLAGLLVTITAVVMALLLYWLLISRAASSSANYSHYINVARQHSIEHLRGQLELQALRSQQQHQQQLAATLQALTEAQWQLNRYVCTAQFCVYAGHGLLLLGVCVLALQGYSAKQFSGPVAVMLVLAVFSLAEVLQSLPQQLAHWGQCRYAAGRLQQLLPQQQYAPAEPNAGEALPVLQQLTFKVSHSRISRSCGKAVQAGLVCGQLLLISGRSGAGKSTLADCIAGLSPDHVELCVNGSRLQATQISQWQRQVGYLQQANSILADTLYVNLTLEQPMAEPLIWQALHCVELDSWARQLPLGLDSWLGDTGSKLSGGQARRICLARLMLTQPRLVILDEPFNGIDSEMASRIWLRMQPYLESRLTILLMHQQPAYINVEGTLPLQQIALS